MQCPHCDVAFSEKDAWERFHLEPASDRGWEWTCHAIECPECEELVIHIERTIDGESKSYVRHIPEYARRVAYPLSAPPRSLPEEVPERFKADYREAHQVLSVSSKASAALSRRVLQSILNEQGYPGRDLSKQIDAVLNDTESDKALPTGVLRTIDAVRNFGNFSAHPISDITSLQIIDVEPEEAEWCLEIVERLFDHYYVRPAKDQKRLDELNENFPSQVSPRQKNSVSVQRGRRSGTQ